MADQQDDRPEPAKYASADDERDAKAVEVFQYCAYALAGMPRKSRLRIVRALCALEGLEVPRG